jgi:hypothetical protein
MRYFAIAFLGFSGLMGMMNQSIAKLYFNKKFKEVKDEKEEETERFKLIAITSILSLVEHFFVIAISTVILFKEDTLKYPSLFVILLFLSYYFRENDRSKKMKEMKEISDIFTEYKKVMSKRMTFHTFFDNLILFIYTIYISVTYIF